MLISIIEIDHLISYQLCMTCLNWSLKLHSRLWTTPHLILTHNTRDFVQIISISFMWLYMFKCDVYTQILVDQNPKRFLSVLYVFESDFILSCLLFLIKMFFVFFFKNWFRGCFARNSRLKASCEMCLREITKSHFHTESLATVSWVFFD